MFFISRRPANQPKPNTRFLNNIIRDTNSHNRALLAKESAESRAKLRELEVAEKAKQREEEHRQRKTRPGPGDTRKRMLGDIAAILGGSSKRRKTENTDTSTGNAPTSSERASEGSSHRSHKNPSTNGDSHAKKEKSRRDRIAERMEVPRRSHRREEERETVEATSSSSRKRKHRERSPRRDSHRPSKDAKRAKDQSSQSESSSDSDPLDEIIGPAPATSSSVRRRGRGANAAKSGIDERFAPDYDPRKDVTPEPDDKDDWTLAAEAFRDRQKWKKQGADRLRSAGFTEEQIKKWEKGDEKDEADVQWTKAGGLREWDRGKVVNKDGTVSLAKDAKK